MVITLLLVIGTASNPELAGELFDSVLAYITRTFGWFYMLSVAFFLVFIVGIALTKWGNIKLGPDHSEPQYSFLPGSPCCSPPATASPCCSSVSPSRCCIIRRHRPAPETVDAAKQAMQIAFFHWGFHIWGIFGIVGLALAYFAFRHGLPLSLRSALYPLIGERIYGPIGHFVDVLVILGTLFGIATTLGLSVTQINAGLNYLWDVPVDITVQVITIAIITCMAIASVVAGLDKG